jgi:hypothetical protein
MNWTRPGAGAAGPSPCRLLSVVLGFAGAAVLAAACGSSGLTGPPAEGVGATPSAPPPICPRAASAGANGGPIVTRISPKFGAEAGGDSVAISGRGFSGATEVEFGNTRATEMTVNSDTRITAISPAGTVSTVCTTVVTPKGSSPPGPAEYFRYVNAIVPTQTATATLISPLRFTSPSAGSSS